MSGRRFQLIIKRFPFDPLRGLGIPAGGLTNPQGGYLKTPLIRPMTTSQYQEEKEKPKEDDDNKGK